MSASTPRVAVIDIGKTNAKVVVRDPMRGVNLYERHCENVVLRQGPYPHFDTEGLWVFILDALTEGAREVGIDSIVVTTHGACAALVDGKRLVLPILDYESALPGDYRGYEEVRPSFEETFSPRLPGGLNLGCQLFFLEKSYPEAFAQARHILLYPQYWVWRLTGVASCEVTSLGCHTDLWAPLANDFSTLVDRQGWRTKFPAVRPASQMVGHLRPDIARTLGLEGADTPVHCGIHDSNASLIPHLLKAQSPFSLVSTGTWIVAFAIDASLGSLREGRDMLANVDAFARPVPSARFMGGREFSVICGDEAEIRRVPSSFEIEMVLREKAMATPTFALGSGPFPKSRGRLLPGGSSSRISRATVASLYVALMAGECLNNLGASGPTVVDGPFAKNDLFIDALRLATGRDVSASPNALGTAEGAALLVGATLPTEVTRDVAPIGESRLIDPNLFQEYRKTWLAHAKLSAFA